MKFRKIVLAGVLFTTFALPTLAQTPQTAPGKPTPPTAAAPKTPTMSPAAGTAAAPSAKPSAASSTLVDINSASPAQLDALPGVGKARADAIIKNRPYKGKDDLSNRHIVPPNVYDGIKDKIIAKQS
jgi:competence protein ComEA